MLFNCLNVRILTNEYIAVSVVMWWPAMCLPDTPFAVVLSGQKKNQNEMLDIVTSLMIGNDDDIPTESIVSKCRR